MFFRLHYFFPSSRRPLRLFFFFALPPSFSLPILFPPLRETFSNFLTPPRNNFSLFLHPAFTRVLDDTFDRHVPALQARRRDARHSQRQRDFALPPRLYRAEPCATAAHRRSPAAATTGAATDASFPPLLASRRREVVAAVVVAVATTTAVTATTVAAAADTVDRKEARVVRARAHALPRMRIEREGPVSLFLSPLRSVSTRVASSSSLPLLVTLVTGVRYCLSPSSRFLLTRLMQSIFLLRFFSMPYNMINQNLL